MKLHAVSVTNLNSLYDTQSIDLDGALKGASLFLIQGPTGAGKSTLMDAISLALFGTTPRLGAFRSEKDVAEQVMSRGTGEARAEVVFSKLEGGSRVRYRAAWMARRARSKADGKVQDTERSLERMDAKGQWEILVSDKRAKVIGPHFERVLERFSADDFQRSMLLAQGRFDAMLHAKPEERAEILERLTNTSEYQKIGERAARMRGAWMGRIGALEAALRAASPMDEAERVAAEAEAEARRGAVEGLKARLYALETGRTWLLRARELAQKVEAAKGAGDALAMEEAEAKGALDALAEHERCAGAFVQYDALTAARGRLKKNEGDQAQASAALPAVNARLGALEGDEARLDALTETADAHLRGLRAPAEAVAASQGRSAQATKELESARAALKAAEGERGAARGKVGATAEALKGAVQAQAQAQRALDALAGDVPIAEALPALEKEAQSLHEGAVGLQEQRQALVRDDGFLKARQHTLGADTQAHQTAQAQRVAPLSAALTEAEAKAERALGEGDRDAAQEALAAAVRGAQAQEGRLKLAEQAVGAQEDARRRQATQRGALDAAEAAAQSAGEIQAQRARDAEAKAEALKGAEARVEPLKRIADLGAQREALQEGDPCPLCGSASHPYLQDPRQRAQAEAIEEALRQAQAARDAAREALEAAQGALQAAIKDETAQQTQAAALKGALGERTAELEAASHRAREALGACGLPGDASPQGVRDAALALRGEIDVLTKRYDAGKAALRALREAREALQRAEEALQKEGQRLKEEGAAIAEGARLIEERRGALAAREAAWTERRGAFLGALARLSIRGGDPEDGMEDARARVAALVAAQEAERGAAEALRRAKEEGDRAQEDLKGAQDRAQTAQGSAQARESALREAEAEAAAALDALKACWDALIEGDAALGEGDPRPERPTLEGDPGRLVAAQDAHLKALRGRLAEVRRQREAQTVRRKEIEATLATLEREGQAFGEEVTEGEGALGRTLAGLEIPDEGILLGRRLPEGEIGAGRRMRDALKARRAQVDAEGKSAEGLTREHGALRPESLPEDASPEALTPEIEASERERDDHQQALNGAMATLERAKQMRAAQGEARSALDAASKKADVWLRLHDLIGVRDGQRFKEFAQALNLQQLLTQANRHLKRLHDRYRLSPIKTDEGLPTLDFEIEDAYRPGATRSLKTLSGGESFLVSLALALGLSDLRTSSMPIETLLLDEGFGTLDPQTLEMALAALQQLQADGRQVGIISHVVGLQERIEARILVEPLGEGRSRVRALVG